MVVSGWCWKGWRQTRQLGTRETEAGRTLSCALRTVTWSAGRIILDLPRLFPAFGKSSPLAPSWTFDLSTNYFLVYTYFPSSTILQSFASKSRCALTAARRVYPQLVSVNDLLDEASDTLSLVQGLSFLSEAEPTAACALDISFHSS